MAQPSNAEQAERKAIIDRYYAARNREEYQKNYEEVVAWTKRHPDDSSMYSLGSSLLSLLSPE